MSLRAATRDEDMMTNSEEDDDNIDVDVVEEDEEVHVDNGPASPLLLGICEESESGSGSGAGLTRSQAYNLYTSHFLSTWNVRTYEFAAIIFTAAAYPDTLTAAAIRGIVRTLASICFSSAVGRWVDRSPDRLRTLMSSISLNRFTVITACFVWFFIVQPSPNPLPASAAPVPSLFDMNITIPALKHLLFAAILLLGIGENLSASGNMMSMERDWVVVAANPAGCQHDLTHLNSAMRRIDLICKLIAPILISLVISSTNTKIGVLFVGGMSAASWAVELLSAKHVWSRNPALQTLKVVPSPMRETIDGSIRSSGSFASIFRGIDQYVQDFRNYFSTKVWIPSLSLSLLHLSALSYGATFITFLLSAGFSLDAITIARAVGSVVEISSTVVTPFGVHVLGKARTHGRIGVLIAQRQRAMSSDVLLERPAGNLGEERTVTGLERLGLWGLCWQLLNLVPVLLALSTLSPTTAPSSFLTLSLPTLSPTLTALTLFTFLSLSRLGLWIFDLTTSQLSQTMLDSSQRASFAGVELSFNAFFELAQHVLVLVFSRPDQFVWIATVSIGAVACSSVFYAAWVRMERGHLVHWERFGACGKGKVREGA